MTRSEFMQSLYSSLKGIDSEERYSIMEEYEMHFEDGRMDGKSEQQIASELGNPIKIGKELRTIASFERAQENPNASNIFSLLLSIIGLSILNLFIILVPLIIYISFVISGALIALAFLCTPVMLLADYLINGSEAVNLFEVFMTMMMFGGALMIAVVLYYIVKWINKLIVKYAQWNVSVIKGVRN